MHARPRRSKRGPTPERLWALVATASKTKTTSRTETGHVWSRRAVVTAHTVEPRAADDLAVERAKDGAADADD